METPTYLRVSDIVEHLYQNRQKYFPDFSWQYQPSSLSQDERLERGKKLHLEHGQKTFGKQGLFSKLTNLAKRTRPDGFWDNRKIFSSDVEVYRGPVYQNDRFMIMGKPDYVKAENYQKVPVEIKPTAQDFYPHHIWQVKLYCILLDPESRYVKYGYLEIAGGRRQKFDVTPGDKVWLVKLIQSLGYPVRM